MTNLQDCKFGMGNGLRGFVFQNATITDPIPGFGTTFTLYSDNLDRIHFIRELQEMDKTGFAENKMQLKNDLIARALDISRKTRIYAQITNNAVLAKEVHYSESELRRAPGYILEDRALVIHDKASENLTSLEPYGVTSAALLALKNAINLYREALPKPRLGITEKKQATDQLNKLFRENDALLRKMDLLVELIRTEQPVFYAAYRNNRKVINTGKNYMALLATVTDAATKSGIMGVKVSFACQNGNLTMTTEKGDKPLIKKTAQKGKFRIKKLTAGTYSVTLNKPGYAEKVVPLTVANNETTELIVELEKN